MKHSQIVTASTAKGIAEGRITAFLEPVKLFLRDQGYYSVSGPVWAVKKAMNMPPESYPTWVPPFQIGQEIYFREPWVNLGHNNCQDGAEEYNVVVYHGTENGKDWESNMEGWRWKSAATMPKSAARLFSDIVDVKCVRVQDIDDVLIQSIGCKKMPIPDLGQTWFTYKQGLESYFIDKFGQQAWDNNIFVWLYKFKLKTA